MGESGGDSRPEIPAWQKSQSATAEAGSNAKDPETTATIEQARKFLQDEEVQRATRDRKKEFLKSKGVDEAIIIQLLDERPEESPTKVSRFPCGDLGPV